MRAYMRIIVVLAMLLTAVTVMGAGEEADELSARLVERMPGLKISSIRKLPQLDLYEVVGNGLQIFYTDANGDLALFGNLVDLQTHANLTEQRRSEVSVVDFSQLPLDLAIVKVKGDGSRRMAVFVDPDCPFCKRLEQELSGVSDVTLYIYLLPLDSIHPDAARKARAVWCAEDRVQAWDALMLQGKEPPAPAADCKDPITDIAKLAGKLSIEGTPGLVFGNGKRVPGAIDAQQIEQLLNVPGKS